MINDVYIKESVKSCTRSKRDESRGIVKVEGTEQHMQYGTRWSAFLFNGTNKTEIAKGDRGIHAFRGDEELIQNSLHFYH